MPNPQEGPAGPQPSNVVPKPTALPPNFANIPGELKAIGNWVLWRFMPPDGKAKWPKVPFQINGRAASTTGPSTWNSFEVVCAKYGRGGYDGIGFVFDGAIGEDGLCFVGIDFDACIVNGLQEPARSQIKALGTYSEFSVSGTGMHCIARAKPLQAIKGPNGAGGIEIYCDKRYFTFTGQTLLPSSDQIKAIPEAVGALASKVQVLVGATEKPKKFELINLAGFKEGPASVFGNDGTNESLSDGLATNVEEIRSAAAAIPSAAIATEGEWMNVARGFAYEAAIYNPKQAEQLYEILDTLSHGAPGYDPIDNRKRFERYMDEAGNHSTPRTIQTVFDIALKHGWQGRDLPTTPTAETTVPTAETTAPTTASTVAEPTNALMAMTTALVPYTAPDHKYPAFRTAAETAETEYPDQRWTIAGLIMEGYPQTLDGDGGIGKSIVAGGMAVSVAAGKHFMGREVVQSPAIYITHEEDEAESVYTLKAYAKSIDVDYASLPIQLACWTDEDIRLAEISDTGAIKPGPFLKTFEERLAANPGSFVVLDCLSDVMQGNLFLRAPPNAFYKGLLQKLCAQYKITMLVLAHPSKTAMSDGSGYEGGTGNKSALRNKLRLELADPKNEDGPRWLSTLKRNRRRGGGFSKPIGLVYSEQHETFVSLSDPEVQDQKEIKFKTVVAAIQQHIDDGQRVDWSANATGALTPQDIVDELDHIDLTAKEVKDIMKWAVARKYLRYVERSPNGKVKGHLTTIEYVAVGTPWNSRRGPVMRLKMRHLCRKPRHKPQRGQRRQRQRRKHGRR